MLQLNCNCFNNEFFFREKLLLAYCKGGGDSYCDLSLSGEQWRHALFTSLFWAYSSQAPRTCCDPRSSLQIPIWRVGGYGRFTVAWFCCFHCCFVLTTCQSSAAACWSRQSWLSSSGRNSTMMQLKQPSCITGSVRPSFSFRYDNSLWHSDQSSPEIWTLVLLFVAVQQRLLDSNKFMDCNLKH